MIYICVLNIIACPLDLITMCIVKSDFLQHWRDERENWEQKQNHENYWSATKVIYGNERKVRGLVITYAENRIVLTETERFIHSLCEPKIQFPCDFFVVPFHARQVQCFASNLDFLLKP